MAIVCAQIADEKRGTEILVLDVRETLVIADFFIIVTGQNRRQIQAMADEMERELKAHGVRKRSLDGYEVGRWILLDFSDVIVHMFNEEAREYYRLDLLWEDAPRLDWVEEAKSVAARSRRVSS
ncbi:MAG: ribosome silencing factor [Planctomycetes bacterium]|nr:ribosome silencing factor [Planctomycetota bacterium]MBI3845666.1 ribosome silencing factor [Planctomycetota bacterium]